MNKAFLVAAAAMTLTLATATASADRVKTDRSNRAYMHGYYTPGAADLHDNTNAYAPVKKKPHRAKLRQKAKQVKLNRAMRIEQRRHDRRVTTLNRNLSRALVRGNYWQMKRVRLLIKKENRLHRRNMSRLNWRYARV